MQDLKHVIAFCIIAFAITYLLEFWLWLSGGLTAPFATVVLMSAMYIPLISAVIVVKFIENESLRKYGISKGELKYYIYSLIYPLAVITLGLAFVAILGTTEIDFTLNKYKGMFPNLSNFEIPIYFIIMNLALAPFINFIPSLGEEYGWRGFLQPKLIEKYSLFKGLLLTGTIWGLWHTPVILMGYNYPSYPNLIGVTAFTIWTILVGFFLGWLRIKSKSIFPAALGHGAINAYIGLGALIAPALDEMLTVPFGLPGFFALFILALLAYLDLTKTS
ncbi:CPBP family intramembrane glutamic endopeptidase [[Eubacterium] cellulosolvens]